MLKLYSLLYLLFIEKTECFNSFGLNRRTFLSGYLLSSNLQPIFNSKLEDDSEDFVKLHKKDNNFYLVGSLNQQSCFHLEHSLIHYENYLLSNPTKMSEVDHINLHIQSPGGSLLPTLGLVDQIINLQIPVYTYIKGYAASAATLLSVVGKKRYMTKHSLMLIHGVQLSNNMPGNYLEVEDLHQNVEQFMATIEDIYLSHSNIPPTTLREMFNHNYWINSSTALKYNLVDYII